MDIFISWSGSYSRQVAEALHNWLPRVIQAVKPWISASDIEKGSRWLSEVSARLSGTNFGLICVTPDNISAPWLLFEAGALSKALVISRVCPVLFGVSPADLDGPLAQFQATSFEREDMAALMKAINTSLEVGRLPEDQLREAFDLWWPKLESSIASIVPSSGQTGVQRNERDLLEEVLETVRRLARRIEGPVTEPNRELFWDFGRDVVRSLDVAALDDSVLKARIANLTPMERKILNLRYSADASWEEIAKILSSEESNITPKGVRAIWARALQKVGGES